MYSGTLIQLVRLSLLSVLMTAPVYAWDRLEQLPIPSARELLDDEKPLFNQSIKLMVEGKNSDAIRALQPMAEGGVVDAQVALGNILAHESTQQQQKSGYRYLYFAANNGNWHAQLVVSNAFREGIFTPVDYGKARHWLKRAAVNGDAAIVSQETEALNHTMMLESVSQLEQAQYDEAEKLLRELAEENVVSAQEKLAGIYQNGFLGEDKKDVAQNWWHRAAQLGSQEAQYQLAMSYFSSPAISDEQRQNAIRMLEKAAQPGKAEAQYQLGIIYLTGQGTDKDADKGIFYYRMAAEQGNVDAQYSLGVRYVLGEGVSKNEYEAHRWFKAAADRGMSKAMHNLALTYLYGMGTEPDAQMAERWFRSAARDGVEKSTGFIQQDTSVQPTLVRVADATPSATKPKTSKKATVTNTRKVETVNGADWFLNLPTKGYTLQVLSAANPRSVDAFLSKHRLKRKNYLHYIDRSNKRPLHVVQYGYFDSREEAEKAAKDMSKTRKNFEPWIRDVKSIRNKIVNI
ncbi:MAG: SPOR domain-containing protein [Gammaproteobacteria bacterium]|nr:SPOR domain-containing protein [Gammaproteobacteria bacterium]